MNGAESRGESAASKRHILAIFNPAAGRNRRRKFEDILARLRRWGCSVEVRTTESAGHAERIARALSAGEFDLVVAAGGDGTVNEVVNGLAGKGIALGIIPIGTANVLADEIGLKKDAGSVARALAFGPTRAIRVGIVNGRRFVMMAGVGFDANVVGRVSLELKRIVGPLAYVWAAGLQGFRDSFAPCRAVIDGEKFESVSVVVCNGRRYGGPFIAAPNADLAAPSLEVVLMRGRGWFSVLRYGIALLFGKVDAWKDVLIVRGRDIAIEGNSGQPMQADGDIVARLPARIGVDPEELRVAVS